MSENRLKIGLPDELGIYEDIARDDLNITIKIVKKRFGKKYTVIKGIDSKDISVRDLLKKLKNALACGGTFKNNTIELQGDHKNKIKELLVKFGFNEGSISFL